VCDEAEIRGQLTAPYSPQQNGVVERKNEQDSYGNGKSFTKEHEDFREVLARGS
jgi:transposase InsO family protein